MQISKKTLLRDSVIYTILPRISFLASIFISPIVSKDLSLKDYGIFGLITSIMAIFQILIIIGQNVVMQNAYFELKSRYKSVWRRSFGMMILAGVVCAALFSIATYFLVGHQLGKNLPWVLLLVSVAIVMSPIDVIAVNYFVLKQTPFPYAIATACTGVVALINAYIGIKLLKLGYMAWVIGLPIGSLVLYIAFARTLFFKEKLYPVFKFKSSFIKNALKQGGPMVPHQLSLYILGTSDRILLDTFNVGNRGIGLYSQSYNLGSYANLLINGIFQALSRTLQENFRSKEELAIQNIRKFTILIPMAITAILTFGCLWMKEIFLFMFRKPELQIGYPIAIIIMCSYMYWPIYTLFTYPLSINKNTKSIAHISLIAAAFNIVGNIIFIPVFGIWASVWVTYIAYMIFGFAGLLNKGNREFLNGYINTWKICVLIFLTNIFALVLSWYIKDIPITYKIEISTVLVLFVLVSYRFKLFRYLRFMN